MRESQETRERTGREKRKWVRGEGRKKKKVFLIVSRIVSPWLWRGQTEYKIDSLLWPMHILVCGFLAIFLTSV